MFIVVLIALACLLVLLSNTRTVSFLFSWFCRLVWVGRSARPWGRRR
jgi:hypothetical protein